MTKKILITFVGNSRYNDTTYYRDEQSEVSTRYIQEAIYKIYCKDFKDTDCIYFLLTEDAKQKNFIPQDEENFGIGIKATFERLAQQAHQNGQTFPKLEPVMISDQQNQQAIWTLFDQINTLIDENSEVYFDITNAFRSLPIVASAILNYAKFTKNIHIEHVLYGNYTYGIEKSPIHDIASMVNIFEWTNGVETYLRTGEASLLKDIVEEDEAAADVEEYKLLVKQLNELNNVLATCRGPEIKKRVMEAKKSLEAAQNIRTEALKPLSNLFSTIEEELNQLRESNSIYIYFDVAKWCLQHNYIQQSATFLREGVNIVLCGILELNMENEAHEQLVRDLLWRAGKTKSLQYESVKKEIEKLNKKSPNARAYTTEDLEKCKTKLEEARPYLEDLFRNIKQLDLFEELTTVRNQMNHASLFKTDKNSVLQANQIVEKLEVCIEKMEIFYDALDSHFDGERMGKINE